MATGGFIGTGYNDYFPLPGLSDSAPVAAPAGSGPRGLVHPAGLSTGPRSLALPTDPTHHGNFSGVYVSTFFDDFYNRIYVEPLFIDFGSISTEASVVTRIWNAYYRESVTLGAVSYDPNLGLSVTGLEPPTLFTPLQQIPYTVIALLDGPASFDSEILWSFTRPWSYSQPVRGTRAKLWELEPNWPPAGKSYTLTYAFKTEVITSRSGREQRIALRTTPRRGTNYRVLLRKDGLTKFNDLMRYWQHRSFVMPELTRFVESSGAMAVGQAAMDFTVMPNWVIAEAQVVLKNGGAMEVRQIDTVVGNTVTFKTVSGTHWPVGTRMYYGMVGYFNSKLSAPRETNLHAQLDLDFAVAPVTDRYIAPPAAAITLAGREVFMKRANWANRVGATIEHEVEELDYDRGPVARFVPVDFPSETRQLSFIGRNFAEMEEIREFFYRMKGQQGEFYMPTWEYDFKPKVTIQMGSSNVRVAGTDFANVYGDSTVYRAMFILLVGGEVLVRKVNTVLQVLDSEGADSFITVTEPWGGEITIDDIVMCGWMPAWRLSSDSLTMEWLTNSVGQVQITMQTIEDLAVETP